MGCTKLARAPPVREQRAPGTGEGADRKRRYLLRLSRCRCFGGGDADLVLQAAVGGAALPLGLGADEVLPDPEGLVQLLTGQALTQLLQHQAPVAVAGPHTLGQDDQALGRLGRQLVSCLQPRRCSHRRLLGDVTCKDGLRTVTTCRRDWSTGFSDHRATCCTGGGSGSGLGPGDSLASGPGLLLCGGAALWRPLQEKA